jgi:DNA-binding transcriptional ArsR family regulator
MANYATSLDRAFHALADPTRRAVIAKLASGSASVKELAEPFDMGLPSFMKHVKVLEESGLITSDKVGRVRKCSLQPTQLSIVDEWLRTQLRMWESLMQSLADYVETPSRERKK